MLTENKISVILPVFNAESYLKESIDSVVAQSWKNWELIIINDGSEDQSQLIIDEYDDERLVKLNQENLGVSAARNKGLDISKGDFICFLDADDKFTSNCLESRIEIFNKSDRTDFVDGKVEVCDENLKNIINVWEPIFKGNPFEELIKLNGKAFFGPTWMIRKSAIQGLRLKESMTHAEDLLFYIQLARNSGNYDYCKEVILKYRSGNNSAMKNLKGLENGYSTLFDEISKMNEVSKAQILESKKKVKYMMIKSYLKNFDILSAISVYLNK